MTTYIRAVDQTVYSLIALAAYSDVRNTPLAKVVILLAAAI